VSSVYQVRWRVLRERLAHVLVRAERAGDDDLRKLAALALALLERHAVDGKGRCRYCRPPFRGWWSRRRRRCLVVPMLSVYLEQPGTIVPNRPR
jgi:hypothetical protein